VPGTLPPSLPVAGPQGLVMSRRTPALGGLYKNVPLGWWTMRVCVCVRVCVCGGGGGLCWVQARAAVGVDFPLMIDCYMSLTVPYVVELARRVRAFVAVGPSSIHSLPFFPAHTTSVLLFPARIRSRVHCAHP
jgi:hypothetical protein